MVKNQQLNCDIVGILIYPTITYMFCLLKNIMNQVEITSFHKNLKRKLKYFEDIIFKLVAQPNKYGQK